MYKLASLTPEQISVLIDKSTDRPFTSQHLNLKAHGTFLCRLCGLALFRSSHQFISSCGWPSFDDELPEAIDRKPDPDGQRTEIVCMRCQGHLGHIFQGEGYTKNNLRHCVNDTAVDFVESSTVIDTEEIIIAGGCFWGVEYYMTNSPGVIKTEVGYCGGKVNQPRYEQVCAGDTGHIESLRVVYDKVQTNLEQILKQFFNLHDPFQHDGQGVNIGSQYLSAIFYYDESQKEVAQQLIQALIDKYQQSVKTQLILSQPFWPAEHYHQKYYQVHPNDPVCHRYTDRFA